MSLYIEVKARYDRTMPNGTIRKVTEPYVVDALSCTEAEARVIEELTPFIGGDFNVTSVAKTKISEIVWDPSADRFYKVKVVFTSVANDGTEKKTPSFILVQAPDFKAACDNFTQAMKTTLADYEIESIAATNIVDVFRLKLNGQ